MGVEEVRAELQVETRSMGNAVAEHLDAKVIGLQEMAIAAPGPVGKDLRSQSLGTVCRPAIR